MEQGGIFTIMVMEKEERPNGAKTWDDSIAVCFICCIFPLAFFTTFALRLPPRTRLLSSVLLTYKNTIK